jgi:hypothetical protein
MSDKPIEPYKLPVGTDLVSLFGMTCDDRHTKGARDRRAEWTAPAFAEAQPSHIMPLPVIAYDCPNTNAAQLSCLRQFDRDVWFVVLLTMLWFLGWVVVAVTRFSDSRIGSRSAFIRSFECFCDIVLP